MSDDTQIAKIGNNLPQPGRPQQPIQANLNQYGNDSTQIAYVQHYDATTNQTVLIMQGASQPVELSLDKVSHSTMTVSISLSSEPSNMTAQHSLFQRIGL